MSVSYASEVVRAAIAKAVQARGSLAGCRCCLSKAACKGLFADLFAHAWHAGHFEAVAAAERASLLAESAARILPPFSLGVSLWGMPVWCDPAAVADVRILPE